jgi:hypothetical protein
MKIVLIVLGIIALVIFAFQIYIAMATGKVETQLYTVIKVEKDFEIRFYPASNMAVKPIRLKLISNLEVRVFQN